MLGKRKLYYVRFCSCIILILLNVTFPYPSRDAFVVYNIHKSSLSVQDVIGKKSKGSKRKITDTTLPENARDDDEPAAKTAKSMSNIKVIKYLMFLVAIISKAFIKNQRSHVHSY